MPISLRSLLGDGCGRGRAGPPRGARAARALSQSARRAHRAGSVAPPHDRRTRAAHARGARGGRAGDAREENPAPQGDAAGAAQSRRKSPPTIRMRSCASWSTCSTRLWNRLYDGVVFEHVETLEKVAEGHEVVYVPCHRSHMDYLLLSYAIYPPGLRDSAHRGGHQSQHAGDRALPAQGRRVLHPPQLSRQRALHRRVHELSRGHHGARAFDRVFHRGRAQPHRPAAAAEDRHARR